MSAENNGRGTAATLRITTKCTSIDEFAIRFSSFVDGDSMFVTGPSPLPAGTRRRFMILLADGTGVFAGLGEVMAGEATLGDRTGARLRFVELGPRAQEMHAKLLAAKQRPRRKTSLSAVTQSLPTVSTVSQSLPAVSTVAPSRSATSWPAVAVVPPLEPPAGTPPPTLVPPRRAPTSGNHHALPPPFRVPPVRPAAAKPAPPAKPAPIAKPAAEPAPIAKPAAEPAPVAAQPAAAHVTVVETSIAEIDAADPTPTPMPEAMVVAAPTPPSVIVEPQLRDDGMVLAGPDAWDIRPRRSRRVVVAVAGIAVMAFIGGAFALGGGGSDDTAPREASPAVAAPNPAVEAHAAIAAQPTPVEPAPVAEAPAAAAPAPGTRAEPSRAANRPVRRDADHRRRAPARIKSVKQPRIVRTAPPAAPPRTAAVVTTKPRMVHLSLTSSPPGAVFVVNGQILDRGVNHATVPTSGAVKITATLRGYKRTTRSIQVGKDTSLVIPLEKMSW